jgi:hypothetical protein
VFLADGSQANLLALMALSQQYPRACFVCYFHFVSGRAWLKLGKRLGIWKRNNVRLATTNPVLAESLGQACGAKVAVVAWPKAGLPPLHASRTRTEAERMTLTVPGSYTERKHMAGTAQALAEVLRHGESHRLCLRANEAFFKHWARTPAFEKALGTTQAQVMPLGDLDKSAYWQQLMESDLVLLPYSPEIYWDRLSGPAEDAISMGKPILVTEGTCTATMFAGARSVLTFEGGEPGRLSGTVVEAMHQLGPLTAHARELAKTFRQQTSMPAVLKALHALFAEV